VDVHAWCVCEGFTLRIAGAGNAEKLQDADTLSHGDPAFQHEGA
jgi:hypothetical protein